MGDTDSVDLTNPVWDLIQDCNPCILAGIATWIRSQTRPRQRPQIMKETSFFVLPTVNILTICDCKKKKKKKKKKTITKSSGSFVHFYFHIVICRVATKSLGVASKTIGIDQSQRSARSHIVCSRV